MLHIAYKVRSTSRFAGLHPLIGQSISFWRGRRRFITNLVSNPMTQSWIPELSLWSLGAELRRPNSRRHLSDLGMGLTEPPGKTPSYFAFQGDITFLPCTQPITGVHSDALCLAASKLPASYRSLISLVLTSCIWAYLFFNL